MSADPAPVREATADQVEQAWHDTKLAQVLYHDWESGSYDDKWSISFDDRCTDYAAARFTSVTAAAPPGLGSTQPRTGPYERSLEIGAGTGFFTLNLMRAGLVREGHVTDISPGMVEAAQRNAARLGMSVGGRVADAETLPYQDDSFDLVIGHAVIHHIPDVELAFREIRRVLRPGGRVVICGEPTTWGHRVARKLSSATWHATTAVTRLGPLQRWRRPQQELDESSRAAALESVVDLHTFEPDALARTVRRAGLVGVSTVTDELTAAWVGWPIRTFEAAVPPERLGWRWRMFAYHSWLRLCRLDEAVAAAVPAGLYYNVSVTGVKPVRP